MFQWSLFGLSLTLLFWCGLAIVYMQRKIYALRNYVDTRPRLDDVWVLFLISGVVALAHPWPMLYGSLVALIGLSLMIMWLDVVLVHLFGFEVNLNNLKIFLQGAESFSGDSKEIVDALVKRSWFLATPLAIVAFLVAIYAQMAGSPGVRDVALASVSVLFLMGITKSRFGLISAPVWMGLLAGLAVLMAYLRDSGVDWPWWQAAAGGGLLIGVVVLKLLAQLFNTPFFSVRSPVRDFIRGARLGPVSAVALKDEDIQRHVVLPMAPPSPSKSFGLCRGANVILITMESLARDSIYPFKKDGARLKFMESFANKSLVSKMHYACCPNTNRAIQHIYQGNYPVNGEYPFLPLLKSQGYRAVYMMISRTRFFNLCDILMDAGFDEVLDRDSLGLDPDRGDYAFLDSVDAVNESLGEGPFFLHLKNEQTHSPYQVVNKEQFDRHEGEGREICFRNAAEEADSVLAKFLGALGELRDLSNTLIIYTGDHGQSFGEFGYVSHSSSSVNGQVRTPLMMSHPALPAGEVARSTHFDVMPTILDLLGVHCESSIFGRSLLHGANHRPLLLYSQTRKGNAPSNASLLDDDSKIMIDLIYGYRYRLDAEDHIIDKLSTADADYQETLLYAALEKRGLISDSAFSPRQKTGG
ncbi:sulfatase-like hydrolase/transferase [Alcanivorax sediminis]|nr:sulfatase-like hydrolase/transferase [Alcanivorax sediminis]